MASGRRSVHVGRGGMSTLTCGDFEICSITSHISCINYSGDTSSVEISVGRAPDGAGETGRAGEPGRAGGGGGGDVRADGSGCSVDNIGRPACA